jgi:hypothetical protein
MWNAVSLQVGLLEKTATAVPDSNCTFIVLFMLLIIITLAGAYWKERTSKDRIMKEYLKSNSQHKDSIETITEIMQAYLTR